MMSIDWQILEETKKKWYRKGLWRGILISIIIATVIYFLWNSTNLSSNFSHIARININGIIFDNSEIVEIIDNLANNDNVKSVLVKINSPGGTVVGSESLYIAINSLSQKKPVISLMGEIATSGGYIVALASNYILARQNTLTGSIGVIVENQNFSELSEKIGVSIDTTKSGKIKGGQNPLSPLDPLVKINNQKLVNYSFDWFISLIKKNRDINQSVLELISDGRTLTGGMAMDLGLIDGIGTEKEALKYLEKNYPDIKGLPIIDIETPSKKSFLNEIINRISIDSLKFVPEYTNSLKLMSLVR
jgi:protease-4